jgi:hypothetical protein
MSTFNVVRFRVKPGQDEAFLDAHRAGKAGWPGLVRGVMLRTGERSYAWLGNGRTLMRWRTHVRG